MGHDYAAREETSCHSITYKHARTRLPVRHVTPHHATPLAYTSILTTMHPLLCLTTRPSVTPSGWKKLEKRRTEMLAEATTSWGDASGEKTECCLAWPVAAAAAPGAAGAGGDCSLSAALVAGRCFEVYGNCCESKRKMSVHGQQSSALSLSLSHTHVVQLSMHRHRN